MKKYFRILFMALIGACSAPLFAASNQYIIIIDAGSSSSRAHVFEYAKSLPLVPVPVIKDIFNKSNQVALSSFASNPSGAGASLSSILDASAAALQAQGVNLAQVPVWVLATAGMRLLTPEQQQAIYDDVIAYIHSHYAFSVESANVRTISGVMEGVYDWLDVNYLSNNFIRSSATVGSIDMGGASTQIAFATTDKSLPNNEVSLNINHTHYTVFSQSFLGLGQNQARATMTADALAASCYPQGYAYGSGTGNFDFAPCSGIYTSIIQNNQVAQNILPTQGQQFVAFSGIYFNYRFFDILQTPTQAALLAKIQSICYLTWTQLQALYNDPFLSGECANGVYFNALLYNTYQLQGSQLTVANQLNGVGIDWTLGALLYGLVQ